MQTESILSLSLILTLVAVALGCDDDSGDAQFRSTALSCGEVSESGSESGDPNGSEGDGDGDGDGDPNPGLQMCWSHTILYQDYTGQCDANTQHVCFGGEYFDDASSSVCCTVGGEYNECNLVAFGTYCMSGQWHVCDIMAQ